MAAETMMYETQVITTTRSSVKAYKILYWGFIILPFVAGLDKFFDLLTHWSVYLSPIVAHVIPAHVLMMIVGLIEMAAAVIVAVNPRIGGFVVAFWLWAIILNLLSIPAFYDVALRDFGLSLAALALAFLSEDYHGLPEAT